MTAATNGAQELFSTVVIKRPSYRGGTTGESWTFTNAYLDTSAPPQFRAGRGSEFDELRDRLVSAATVTPVLPGEADTGHTSTSRGTAADAARKDDTR